MSAADAAAQSKVEPHVDGAAQSGDVQPASQVCLADILCVIFCASFPGQYISCGVSQVVTPWDVTGGTDGKIDYDKLIREVQAAFNL